MSTHPLTHTLPGAVTSDFRLLQKFSIKRAHESTNSEDNQIGYWILVINENSEMNPLKSDVKIYLARY